MTANNDEFRETHKVALALAQSIGDEAASIAYHIMRGEYGHTQVHEDAIAKKSNDLTDNLGWLREQTKGEARVD